MREARWAALTGQSPPAPLLDVGQRTLSPEWGDLCRLVGAVPQLCRTYWPKAKEKVERGDREIEQSFMAWLTGEVLPPLPSSYQRLRDHLAYVQISAAAEHLADELDRGIKQNLSAAQVLEQFLAIEIEATRERRQRRRQRSARYRDA